MKKMRKNEKNEKMKKMRKNEKNEKNKKKLEENCNFSFFGKLQCSSSFFIFCSFFDHVFLSFLLPMVELMKSDKK